MPQVRDVMTGEVAVGGVEDVLRSSAIGSCVVISVYSLKKKVGGLAHVMLSGYAPHHDDPKKTRYAGNAIDALLSQMASLGADMDSLEVCLIGAANILKREDDITAKNNLDSAIELLREKKIRIKAQSVGGNTRRSVLFDIGKAMVFYTEGDEEERLLWAAEERGACDKRILDLEKEIEALKRELGKE